MTSRNTIDIILSLASREWIASGVPGVPGVPVGLETTLAKRHSRNDHSRNDHLRNDHLRNGERALVAVTKKNDSTKNARGLTFRIEPEGRTTDCDEV